VAVAAKPRGFEGSFTLLVTPLLEDGRIDARGYARLVEHHLAAGGQGLFAVCGTGEMAELTLQERLWLAREAASRVAGAVPVVATANLEPDPRAQADEVARMAETGVDGVVLVPPRRHSGDAAALTEYFARLAERSPVPVLLYEWPGSRPAHIPAEVYGQLVAACGVVGIKDTTCTRAGLAAKVAAAPESVVYQANHPLLREALSTLGARGTMTITSAVRPDLLGALWRARVAGQDDEVAALTRELVFLDAVLAGCHPAGAKWLLQQFGILSTHRVRSGRSPSEAEVAALAAWAAGAPPWHGPLPQTRG
jgi:4-hydroxy-tetrahydrodipicolinate synthase